MCFIFFFEGVITFSLAQTNTFLPFTKLEIKNGLPGINVRKITKDKFGFMWFATQDGLSRFDGRSYINLNAYNVDAKRKFLGVDIFDIRPDITSNYLWALSAYGGLNKIDLVTCNVISSYQVKQSVKPDTTLWYKCLAENSTNLLIGTNEGIVCRYNKKLSRSDFSFSLAEKFNCAGQLEDIMIDDKNQVWYFISGKGVLITDSTLTKKISFISSEQLDNKPFYFTDYSVFGELLFLTTTDGLRAINTKTLTPLSIIDPEISYALNLESKELHCISIDNSVAIITGKNTLYRIDLVTKKIETIFLAGNYEDRSWITLTNSIYLDKQNIWLGSQYGIGWIKNIYTPFVPYYNSYDGKNIKINHAITLYAATDSSVFVCGDDGLYSVNPHNSVIKKFNTEDYFYSVFPIFNGYFIASGVSKGLQLFDKNFIPINIQSIFPELNLIKNDLLMCSAKMGDSIVFMASQNKNGLYIWNKSTKKINVINSRTGRVSLRNDNINRLYLDSKNLLWIVCENAVSIFDYAKKEMKHLDLADPQTGLPLSINMDLCEAGNRYWLTCYGTGIVELSEYLKIKKIYKAKDGINNLGLYKIFPFSDSTLIASSNNGLTVLNINTGRTKNYFVEDGLQSNSFEEASGDKLGNNIYLGGINGLTKIDISRFVTNIKVPHLSFSTITLTTQKRTIDTLNIEIEEISIPTFVSQVKINFSSIDYSSPEKIKYAYRILGKDDGWNYTNQVFIQFFSLVPGTHILQVQAFNEDGVPSEIKELTLIFLPKWYQTWQFKVLILLLILAAVYGLYRFRINHLKKEEKIRNQVASDLHDELGSTLNSVKVFTSLAMMEENKTSHLEKIKEATQYAISGVKDIIWVLDDKRDTLDHLLSRIDQFAKPVCEAAGILYKQQSDANENYKLGKEEKRNLYMIIKESINNSIKYSECSVIELLIKNKSGKINITISDNGKGFEKEKTTSGYGLKNILRRAEEIKYHAELNSSPGNGTLIYLEKK